MIFVHLSSGSACLHGLHSMPLHMLWQRGRPPGSWDSRRGQNSLQAQLRSASDVSASSSQTGYFADSVAGSFLLGFVEKAQRKFLQENHSQYPLAGAKDDPTSGCPRSGIRNRALCRRGRGLFIETQAGPNFLHWRLKRERESREGEIERERYIYMLESY